MGNYNSGRRPEIWDPRPQVEDANVIDIPLLRAYNALTPGNAGLLTWPDGKSRAGFTYDGETLTLDYSIKGQAYRQFIQVASMQLKLNHAPRRTCLLCPECGYRGYKLYLSRKPRFLCRKCQGLTYELQTYRHGSLCYMLLQSIKEERRYFEHWKARKA
jgi:hypothetical protein